MDKIASKIFEILLIGSYSLFVLWIVAYNPQLHPIVVLIAALIGAWIFAWFVGLGGDDEASSTPYPDED